MYTFTKNDCLALIAFASRDETRKHLNAVCIKPSSGTACTTDGHSLLQLSGLAKFEELDREILIPLSEFERAAKMTKLGSANAPACDMTITESDSVVAMAIKTGKSLTTIECHTVADKFPPVEEYIPGENTTGGVNYSVDADLLARLVKVQKASGSKCRASAVAGELDPIRYDSPDGPRGLNFTAVIMPVRV